MRYVNRIYEKYRAYISQPETPLPANTFMNSNSTSVIKNIKQEQVVSVNNNKLLLLKYFYNSLLILFILNYTQTIAKQNRRADTTCFTEAYSSKFEAGTEYLTPTVFGNNIKTISIHGFFWKHYFKKTPVLINIGLTCTYAWGFSRQWYPISDSILKPVDYKTSAFGIGPSLQIECVMVKIKRFSLVAEASGGFILYDKHFPYGGDAYNIMFRTGPSVTYKINHHYLFKIGYRWMHVSNGKGYGNQNPFYEAQGVNLSFIKIFK